MINKLTVIGSGLMGHGIALKFAQHGCIATVFDPNQSSMDTLFKRIEISLIQMDVSKLNIKKCLSLIKKSNNLKRFKFATFLPNANETENPLPVPFELLVNDINS